MSSRDPSSARSIIPLFLTVFLDLLGLGIAIPVLAVAFLDPTIPILPPETPLAARTFGYGMFIAAYPFAQFFGAPVWGALSDRHGRKPILILALVATSVGYTLFALGMQIYSLPLLFFSRLIDGFGGGSISAAMSAIADISDSPKAKTRNYGLVGMAFGLGFILGPYIGGKLADPTIVSWFTVATPFWFAAGLALLNIFICLWIFHETNHHRIHTPISALTGFRNFAKAFTLRHLRMMFLTVFLVTLGFNFFTQFFQVFLIERFHFTTGDIGDFFAYVGIWLAATQGLLTRPVSHFFSTNTIYSTTVLLLGLTFPLLLLPEETWGLYAVVPFIAVFQGLSQPTANTIISDLADASSQGEVMGINQSIISMAMMIPPIIAGIIAGVHITLPIIAACLLTLAGWSVFALSFNRRRTEPLYHEL